MSRSIETPFVRRVIDGRAEIGDVMMTDDPARRPPPGGTLDQLCQAIRLMLGRYTHIDDYRHKVQVFGRLSDWRAALAVLENAAGSESQGEGSSRQAALVPLPEPAAAEALRAAPPAIPQQEYRPDELCAQCGVVRPCFAHDSVAPAIPEERRHHCAHCAFQTKDIRELVAHVEGHCETLVELRQAAFIVSLQEEIESQQAEIDRLRAEIARVTEQRNEYRTLSGIGAWHDDCRPNRKKAAAEIEKSQKRIDAMADEISNLHQQLAARDALQRQLDDAKRGYQIIADDWNAIERAKEHAIQQLAARDAALTALRDTWRKEAAAITGEDREASLKRFGTLMDPDGYIEAAVARESCADDLDALLASPRALDAGDRPDPPPQDQSRV